ncbi:class I SAM-dependent methyltransferase [Timonella sp. A28]|uniref:class I SAM-dependent methyltransferase n=1 Tax=Timonella sp. A28 TaxID=3442640 RepID=UPI003EB6B9DD
MEPSINEDVKISWDDARSANQRNWDERVPIHVEAGYGISAFHADPNHISGVVAHDIDFLAPHLPESDIGGLKVCHLQCHIGTDTVSLARLGAHVTGIDFSQSALEAAAILADGLGVKVQWLEGDVLEAATLTREQFDVVYTSIGTICWLSDLERWAQQISALLTSDGVFYIRDGHPSLYALDEVEYPPLPRYRYFPNGKAQIWDDATTYGGEGTIASSRTYEWPHSIAEVVTALLKAGLRIEAMHEGETLPWEFSPHMVRRDDDNYEWPEPLRNVIPCTFTIVARKVN